MYTRDGRTLQFRGHRIVDAVIDDLMDRSVGAPTLSEATPTPMFVYADERDPVLLGTLGIIGRATSPEQQAYVQEYARLVRESLAKVPAAFSPSLGVHPSLAIERFHSAIIDGNTLAETLGRWYFESPGPVKLIAAAAAGRGVRGAGRGGGRAGRGQ